MSFPIKITSGRISNFAAGLGDPLEIDQINKRDASVTAHLVIGSNLGVGANEVRIGTPARITRIMGDLAVDGSSTISVDETINGNTIIGSAITDTLTVNAEVVSAILPDTTFGRDLGSVARGWRDIYLYDGTDGRKLSDITTLVPGAALVGVLASDFTNFTPATNDVYAALVAIDAAIGSGGATLDTAYNAGPLINIDAVAGPLGGPVTITRSAGAAANLDCLVINNTPPSGGDTGRGIYVVNGANAIDLGIQVNSGGNAKAIGISYAGNLDLTLDVFLDAPVIRTPDDGLPGGAGSAGIELLTGNSTDGTTPSGALLFQTGDGTTSGNGTGNVSLQTGGATGAPSGGVVIVTGDAVLATPGGFSVAVGTVLGAGAALVGGVVSIVSGTGKANTGAGGGVGGAWTGRAGTGGSTPGSGAAAAGGVFTGQGGTGGLTTAGPGGGAGGKGQTAGGTGGAGATGTGIPGVGGPGVTVGGMGGARVGTGTGGAGGLGILQGGAAGASTVATAGGDVEIDGGLPTSSGARGAVKIGTAVALSITSGNVTDNPLWTHTGTLAITDTTTSTSLAITKTGTAGKGISVSMGAVTTDNGIDVTMVAGATGEGIRVTVADAGPKCIYATNGINSNAPAVQIDNYGTSAALYVRDGTTAILSVGTAGAGAVAITATATSQVTTSVGNMSVGTTAVAGDLTFQGLSYTTGTYNQSADTTYDRTASGEALDGATSLIGAINRLARLVDGVGGSAVQGLAATGGLTAGQLVAFDDQAGAARVAPADDSSTGAERQNAVGFVTNSPIAGATAYVKTSGVVTTAEGLTFDAAPAAADVGKVVYGSFTTAGNVTLTAPSGGSGHTRLKVGILKTTTSLLIQFGEAVTM